MSTTTRPATVAAVSAFRKAGRTSTVSESKSPVWVRPSTRAAVREFRHDAPAATRTKTREAVSAFRSGR